MAPTRHTMGTSTVDMIFIIVYDIECYFDYQCWYVRIPKFQTYIFPLFFFFFFFLHLFFSFSYMWSCDVLINMCTNYFFPYPFPPFFLLVAGHNVEVVRERMAYLHRLTSYHGGASMVQSTNLPSVEFSWNNLIPASVRCSVQQNPPTYLVRE